MIFPFQNDHKTIEIMVFEFSIKPSTSHKDTRLVCEHWKKAWESECNCSENDLEPDWKESTAKFLDTVRTELGGKTFIAYNSSSETDIFGSISCQVWKGPVPIEVVDPKIFSMGTIWGLHVDIDKVDGHKKAIEIALVNKAKDHLRNLGCHKVIVLTIRESHPHAFLNCGFGPKNMLTLKLRWKTPDTGQNVPIHNGIENIQIKSEGKPFDSIVVKNWRKMWTEVGIPEEGLVSDMERITLEFIENARQRLGYQTIVARRNSDGKVVGSISCQRWGGPFPQIAKSRVFSYGTIWAVYVDPSYRRKGIATALVQSACIHLEQIGCDRAVLIAASEAGQCVYEKVGFDSANALVCNLAEESESENNVNPYKLQIELEKVLRTSSVTHFSDKALRALVTATPRQLLAVLEGEKARDTIFSKVKEFQLNHGLYVDPENNWFTKNAKRFGRGFDMKKLSQDETALATKFDRLSERYDHWTVGNQSKVERFIVSCAKGLLKKSALDSSSLLRTLDVACGIGLQGQTLRLCGYQGTLVGLDISPGMIARVLHRGCYDDVIVANANGTFSFDAPFDVVICTGAMELLNHRATLIEISKVTRTGGQLWVSFQAESIGPLNPTEHQGVQGVSEQTVTETLVKAGFEIVVIERCPDAFYTPSPDQNGDLLAVPYFFVVARKRPKMP